jgi:uncharacterized repeat protein (TIGR01451 family)
MMFSWRKHCTGRFFRSCPGIFRGLVPAIFLTFFAAAVCRAADRTLPGHVPPSVRNLTPVDRLDPAKHLGLAISLPLRNTNDLTNLIRELYDPASANYHHYLTTEEFTERFGPVPYDYQRVAGYMTSNGLTVTRTYANRLVLDVDGSVADIERTFHINLRVFNHPTESRKFFAPDTDPVIDANLPVVYVAGLDNFVIPHPASLVRAPVGQPRTAGPFQGSGSRGTYIGADFRTAYLPGVALTGVGQTVGLFELDGYFPADISAYESVAHLPNVPVTNVLINFGGSAGPDNDEVALDIDMAICMAPGLSEIIVYEGVQPNDILEQMAVDNKAKELSCSWGWSGPGFINIPPIDTIFMEYQTQGQSFFAASGDSGAYAGTNSFISTPSDDPNITVVGGTTLMTDSNQNYLSEKVWNWFPSQAAASSGGVSQTNGIPYWQQGIDMTANLGSTNNRNIPDVAFTADNIFLIADDGVTNTVGGTSAAAPLWAGFTALVNQQALAAGLTNVGFLNPTLYSIGGGSGYLNNFHDITTGNNINTGSGPDFPATTGYDLCTGWGTPAGTNLINTLAPPTKIPRIVTNGAVLAVENCLPTNGAIDPGETVTVQLKLLNAGRASTSNLVATLLANSGVSPSGTPQAYGAIAPGVAVSRPFTFTANGACGGTITTTLHLQDGSSNYPNVSFNWTLGVGAGGLTTFSQNFDTAVRPLLPSGWSTSASGGEPGWVTATTHHDTSPNAAFAKENASAGLTQLISPAISINLPTAQLEFRQWFNTDSGFDGGILTISINGGPYTDILAAGGSFVTNGYNQTLGNTSGNPIGGAQAWSGNSGGFITTIVNLPASAAGQSINLNWQFGTDVEVGGSGWYVDTVSIIDGSFMCCSGSADMAVTQTASPNPAIAGQNLTYTLAITNMGTAVASGVTVTDTLPAGVTFVSASPGASNLGGTVVAAPGTMANGTGTNITITVKPTTGGSITNVATVASTSPDSNPANNSATLVTTVDALPVITAGPTNVAVIQGSTASFSAAATGTPSPAFQWFFNTTTPVGGNSGLLTLTNVQPSQAGSYFMRVTNVVGSTNSIPATLTVYVPPAITSGPTNQVAAQGGSVSFAVSATGIPAPGYRWFFNTTNPVGVNSNVLTLNSIQPSEAGLYTVLVTNVAGTTNSSAARLTLLQPPNISSITVTHTNVSVSFQSVVGLNYTLEYKNLFTDPSWTILSPSTPGNGGSLTLQDTNTLPAIRFYRILCD